MNESPAVDWSVSRRSAQCVLFGITSGDGFSRGALRKAARLAAALGAELELFCCAFDPDILRPGPFSSRSPEEGIQQYIEQRQKQLWALSEDLRATGLSVYSCVEWNSRADEGIVREVLRRRPAFLVVESFRKSPAERGPANAKLIETCPCPLLLIRSAHSYPSRPRIVAAVDPMHPEAKPAGLDDAIVGAAADLSRALSGELHLFHARAPRANEQEVASRVAEIAQSHEISSLHTHLVDGDVTECLPGFSSDNSVDVVAMGALSRSLIQRLLIGDTAARLLHELECDVLIVKPPAAP